MLVSIMESLEQVLKLTREYRVDPVAPGKHLAINHAEAICEDGMPFRLAGDNEYVAYRWCSVLWQSCLQHLPFQRSAALGGRAGGRYRYALRQ